MDKKKSPAGLLETLDQSHAAKLDLKPQNFRSQVPRITARGSSSCCSLPSSHPDSLVTLPVFFPRLSIRNLQSHPRGRGLHPLSHQQPHHLRGCHQLCVPQRLLQGRPGPLRHAVYKYVLSHPQEGSGQGEWLQNS